MSDPITKPVVHPTVAPSLSGRRAVNPHRDAYERMRPLILAAARSKVRPLTVDVPSAVTLAHRVAKRVLPYREQILELAGIDPRCVDDLLDAARAAAYANVQWRMAKRPRATMAELSQEATELRAKLYGDLLRLLSRGLLSEDELDGYVGTVGFKIVATDLELLASVIERAWGTIQDKTAITLDEVNDAYRLGADILEAVGVRERSPAELAEMAQMRLLAFNLLLSRYGEVRRALSFVRRNEGDLDSIMPSLYTARRRHRKKSGEAGRPKSEAEKEGEAPSTRSTETSGEAAELREPA